MANMTPYENVDPESTNNLQMIIGRCKLTNNGLYPFLKFMNSSKNSWSSGTSPTLPMLAKYTLQLPGTRAGHAHQGGTIVRLELRRYFFIYVS